jgi:hypothetical protein
MAKAVKNAAHVLSGRNRFPQKEPVATLFESADELKALRELHHKLQFFPTPPWAVRALIHTLRGLNDGDLPFQTVLEPCAGLGHIIVPLREEGLTVLPSDIHDFGKGFPIMDFLEDERFFGDQADVVITNPPYGDPTSTPHDPKPTLAERFVLRGLEVAPEVYSLCHFGFLGNAGRFNRLNAPYLTDVFVLTERADMVLGAYDPKASTATDSAWYRFRRNKPLGRPALLHFIEPGLEARFTKTEDAWI